MVAFTCFASFAIFVFLFISAFNSCLCNVCVCGAAAGRASLRISGQDGSASASSVDSHQMALINILFSFWFFIAIRRIFAIRIKCMISELFVVSLFAPLW